MSYPGRPPLVQGMPPMAYMPMSGPPPPLMSAVMPIQHMVPMQVTSAPQIRAFPKLNPNREQLRQLQLQGPPVTVFVGNITERAPDTMIRQILSACGPVISWKKVKGFGFCELAGPDAGLRAVRILHDLMVGEKRLVAKVDTKTKAVLDEYKAEKRKKEKGSSSPLQDELEDDEPLDEESQMLDTQAIERIKQLLVEYEEEMNNFELKKEEEVLEKRNKILDEADVEEEKRDLITREIGKFREIMKKQEEEREVSRKKDKDRHGERARTRERSSSHSPSPKRRVEKDEKKKRHTRSRSKEKVVERDRSRSEHEPVERVRESRDSRESREAQREARDRERERERIDRDRDRDRERDRDDKVNKSTKDLQKEKEIEEETKEKKRAERRTREKEASYQERLRGWENRERKKLKDYEKEREKDRQRDDDRERDAKRLKEFLEDYDDERDDVKFYKGRELQKRLAERVKEAESDGRDRVKEKEEIEELKNKIFSGGEFEDPNAEFERIKREREEQYKPKLLIDVKMEHWKQREKEKGREQERQRLRDRDREQERQRQREEREKFVVQQAAQELAAVEAEPIDSDSDMDNEHFSPKAPPPEKPNDLASDTPQLPDEDSRHSATPNHEEETANPIPHPTMKLTLSKPIVFSPHGQTRDSKRKKLDLREVFNPDEDDTSTQVKKRKLVPLDYNEDKKTSKKDKENGEKKSEESIKSQEEKRKHIKSLIEKIPTEKEALFAYQLDWSVIDNGLMEKKIRPWINKKIIEYIGEPEPTLVDFICSKVMAGSQPQIILEDVQMVLDEEAEVFVVKMWRLLIYEVEAKKLGISN